MKKCFLAILFLMIPALGMADNHNTSVVEMWQCELKEGKTMKEVEANNKKWLKSTISTLKGTEPEITYEDVDTSITPPRPRLYGLVGAELIEEVWKNRLAAKKPLAASA